MPALQLGSDGAAVLALQRLLNAVVRPTPPLRLDGDYGAQTRRAVLAAQRTLGLEPTGVADDALRAALEARLARAAAPTFPTDATWMAVARGEIGQVERRGGENPRIVAYHATTALAAREDEVPWCSSFVNWVMERAGYRGTGSAAASSWLRWGVELEAPRPGCVTVLKRRGRSSDAATGSATASTWRSTSTAPRRTSGCSAATSRTR
jgi:uncharacterized protein (TIGR02594 family)